MTKEFDVIIIGAGPAGATLARLLSKDFKVLLTDKRTNGEKCCGGLIAPDAQKVLATFDVGIPKSIIADPQLFYVRSIDLKTKNEQNYQRHYTNVNRSELDKYLIAQIPKTVEYKAGCRYVAHSENAEYVTVSFIENNKTMEYRCKILVGADGAKSLVRKALYNDFDKIRKYIAIQGEYKKTAPINHYAVFFEPTINDFYSWLIPKDNTVLLGGAFDVSTSPRKQYNKLFEKVNTIGYTLTEEVKINACFLLRPKFKNIKTGKGRIALIGESAGFISPSSSEGFSFAYLSAMALAKTINAQSNFNINKYKMATFKLRLKILLKNIKGCVIYNSLLRNIIFKLGIRSIGNK